jgi:hypothetical protein
MRMRHCAAAHYSTITACCLLFCTAGHAAEDAPTAWFQSTTQTLYDAVASGETAVWDRVLDGNCVITTEDGEVLGKAKFLQEMRPLPPGSTGRIKVRDLTIRFAGRAAVVHYWLDETEDIFEQRLKTIYVETDVYRRARGSWKMIAAHITVVPRDLEPIPVDSSAWKGLVGEYRVSDESTSRYRVFLREGALYGGSNSETATRLIPLSPLVFFQQGSIHTMVFVQDASGAVIEVRELHKFNEVRLQRIKLSGDLNSGG